MPKIAINNLSSNNAAYIIMNIRIRQLNETTEYLKKCPGFYYDFKVYLIWF